MTGNGYSVFIRNLRYLFCCSSILMPLFFSQALAENLKNNLLHPSQEEICSFNGIDFGHAIVFASKLKSDIILGNRASVADGASFPLRVNKRINHGKLIFVIIQNKKEFLSQYSKVITKKIIRHIKNSKSKDVFCNYQGAAFANGTIWFTADSKGAHFSTINQ